MKPGISILILCLLLSLSCFAQNAEDKLWIKSEETSIQVTGARQIIPKKYVTYKIIPQELKLKLFSAPNERTTTIYASSCIITLPLPNGTLQRFRVIESSVMDETLALSFPQMRTFSVRGIDDPHATGKLDWNDFGFHGMVLTPDGNFFIDPYCLGNIQDYISYYTSDFVKPTSQFISDVDVIRPGEPKDQKKHWLDTDNNTSLKSTSVSPCLGAQLRTYRLAVACTGEYAVAATGSATPNMSQILSKVVTSVNRVDGVYETEVSVRLVLVSTTTLTLYNKTNTSPAIVAAPTATAQPFSGNTVPGTLIGESQNVITNLIGSSNFDIGHTFCSASSGLANLGCVCTDSNKARGITGSPNPVGDPYDIDYLAHEIGHQFNGEHTFNSGTGSCSGNRSASSAMEPGSGVTIMAYAGICGAVNDLELHSIPYFHGISYDQISIFTNSGNGNSCAVTTTTGNQPPLVTAPSSQLIPKSTPFYLSGSAIDPDGDPVTYSWEEMDAGFSTASWNSGAKPFFRSYTPVSSGTRFFPSQNVAASGNFTGTRGEYLPTNAQTLNFRLTARDNKMGGGGVCYASTSVVLDASGPLLVTYPNVPQIIWPILGQRTITWDVNGTDVLPVDCDFVKILISYDSGNTYSVLVNSTPNDGSELIPVPTVTTIVTTCRIKVESIGNIFYDVGNNDFTISTDPGAGIAEASQNNFGNLIVWPNPFNNELKVSANNLGQNKTIVVSIVDILGKTILQTSYFNKSVLDETLNLSSLSQGVYFITISSGDKRSVYRIVKE